MCLIEYCPRFFSRNYCIRPEAALQERFCLLHRRFFPRLQRGILHPFLFSCQARCFSAPPRRGRYCYHFFLTPKRNGNSKKRASRGRSPLIPPIAPDVVVADCAKLASSKSAALTRSVAPPLQIKPASLDFDLISIFFCRGASPAMFSLGRPFL